MSPDLVKQRLPTRTTWNGSATRVAWSSPVTAPARARLQSEGGHDREGEHRLRRPPPPQGSGGVALDHVDHDLGLEVDHASGKDGRMEPVHSSGTTSRRPRDGRLCRSGRGRRPGESRVRSPLHHRPPAHAELGRHRGHRTGVGTDLAAPSRRLTVLGWHFGADVVGVLESTSWPRSRPHAAPAARQPATGGGRTRPDRGCRSASDPGPRRGRHSSRSPRSRPSSRW